MKLERRKEKNCQPNNKKKRQHRRLFVQKSERRQEAIDKWQFLKMKRDGTANRRTKTQQFPSI